VLECKVNCDTLYVLKMTQFYARIWLSNLYRLMHGPEKVYIEIFGDIISPVN